jgi:hypothetical protein
MDRGSEYQWLLSGGEIMITTDEDEAIIALGHSQMACGVRLDAGKAGEHPRDH